MSTPPPAGWYPTSPTDTYVRYWTGQRWSDHTAKAGTPSPPPDESARVAAGTPRPGWARTALTAIALLLILVGTREAADLILSWASLPPRGMLSDWASIILMALVLAAPATRVGYRWRDIPLFLIPFVSLYLAYRVVWRCSYLPFADWVPRPEAAASWRQVPHPTRPGDLLYAPVRANS